MLVRTPRRIHATRLRPLVLFVSVVVGLTAPARAQQPANAPPPTAPLGTPVPDDQYRFAPEGSESVPATIARAGDVFRLTWPRVAAAGWDTALLSVRSLGAEADPWVEITAGATRIEQHLDPNAWGLRWLNLSALRGVVREGTTVEIRPRQLTLDEGASTLRVFDNRLPLDGPILVLAPHPDDAEIAAFGLYAGRNATVVTVTSGNAGDFNYRATIPNAAEHYLMKGYLRAVDSVTVPWQGGIPPARAFNLGYFDARLATMRAVPDQVVPEMYGPNTDVLPYRRANIGTLRPVESRTNTWNHLVEDLAAILNSVKPAVIVMPHPLLDSHLDHDYTAVALVEALDRWNGNPRFLLYTNHSSNNRYPWGPSGTAVTLPPWSASDFAVQRLYSHPLEPALVHRKLFALESMHDLRLSPEEQMTVDDSDLLRRPDYPRNPDTDYFRRGPRANELFFNYDRDGVRQIIRSFLAQTPAAPTSSGPPASSTPVPAPPAAGGATR